MNKEAFLNILSKYKEECCTCNHFYNSITSCNFETDSAIEALIDTLVSEKMRYEKALIQAREGQSVLSKFSTI